MSPLAFSPRFWGLWQRLHTPSPGWDKFFIKWPPTSKHTECLGVTWAFEKIIHLQILSPITLLLGLYLYISPLPQGSAQHPVICAQSCLTLCNPDPMDCSLPGSPVHRILQARILERSAVSYSRGSSWPRGWARVSCISCIGKWQFFTTEPPGKPISIFDRCQTLWDDQMSTSNSLHYQLPTRIQHVWRCCS